MTIVIFFTKFAISSGYIQNLNRLIKVSKGSTVVSAANKRGSCCSFPTDFASVAECDAGKLTHSAKVPST